jgi:hypothetical protein
MPRNGRSPVNTGTLIRYMFPNRRSEGVDRSLKMAPALVALNRVLELTKYIWEGHALSEQAITLSQVAHDPVWRRART